MCVIIPCILSTGKPSSPFIFIFLSFKYAFSDWAYRYTSFLSKDLKGAGCGGAARKPWFQGGRKRRSENLHPPLPLTGETRE